MSLLFITGPSSTQQTFFMETRNALPQSALELGQSHCPNGRLLQDLGFGGFAFVLKLPELLDTNLPTVRAMLGQASSFLIGPKFSSQQGNEFGSPTRADEHNQVLP